MPPIARFIIFILVSMVVFFWLIRFSLRQRESKPEARSLMRVMAIVVVGGMLFAKYGNNMGLPWWIYYTIPALATLLLPPVVFRMSVSELRLYLILALFSSPMIHVMFSLVLGWKEYMPFIPVPSLRELLS
ncbi:hypothetical protein [Undibacterium aquatile]|uniref:Tripartite tricarboxylate transporter TctB family protein n=1 Tax=Undibacterium aquatile TaxID=1537398 RepID=A0ABR6XKS9_9BURK|nr:hypothetical protein [Undibacterium aquatile]MBC3813235.1 hypothetical protein [Undibacterium aquatile]